MRDITSPRSLQACEELGIIPEELFFENEEELLKKHPEMISLPKDIFKIRFMNINNYRQKLIKLVKEKRNKIISNPPEKKDTDRKKETSIGFDLEKDYIEMADKEKTTIEKLKQRQKNLIEAEIEIKIKSELLKIKSDMKDSLIKEINDKIQKERKQKAIIEDKKIKEKESMREKTLKQKLEEQEKKNKKKQEAEKKRLNANYTTIQCRDENVTRYRKHN